MKSHEYNISITYIEDKDDTPVNGQSISKESELFAELNLHFIGSAKKPKASLKGV